MVEKSEGSLEYLHLELLKGKYVAKETFTSFVPTASREYMSRSGGKMQGWGEGGSWGAQDQGNNSVLSCLACSHQKVFTENLNAEEPAERGSDGRDGRSLSDEI